MFAFLFGQALVGSSVLFRVSGEQLFESSRCRRRSARLPGSDLNQNSRTGISPKRVMTDRKITRVTDDSAPGNMPDWPAAAKPEPTANRNRKRQKRKKASKRQKKKKNHVRSRNRPRFFLRTRQRIV